MLGGLALVVAAMTPRRAYATVGIIALFIIPPIVIAISRRRRPATSPARRAARARARCSTARTRCSSAAPPTRRRRPSAACPAGLPRSRRGRMASARSAVLRSGATCGSQRMTADIPARPSRPAHRSSSRRLALVRQRRRGQRHHVRARARRHGPAGPQRRRQVDAAAHAGRACCAVGGRGLDPRASRPGGDPALYRRVGLVPEREAVYGYLTGRRVRAPQRPAAGHRRSGRRRGAGDRARSSSRTPQDRTIGDLLEGHAPAGQGRRRARPRPADPAARRAVQRHGPAPAAAHDGRCCGAMAAEGRTILFSSHILEEVERLAENVLVIYAGRLAASGDFREIRRLMTDRPHTFTIRSSRRPAAGGGAARRPARSSASELRDGLLAVRPSDFGAFTRALSRASRRRPASACSSSPRPTTRSRASSPTWCADDRAPRAARSSSRCAACSAGGARC